MESRTMGRLVWMAIALAIAGGIAWGWARWKGGSAIDAYRAAVAAIGYARGGHIPDEAAIRERAEALAADHGIALTGLTVTRRETATPDRVAKLANERLGSVGAIRMDRVVFDVRGQVSARRLGFTTERDLSVELSYRSRVELAPGAGDFAPPPPPEIESGPRGL